MPPLRPPNRLRSIRRSRDHNSADIGPPGAKVGWSLGAIAAIELRNAWETRALQFLAEGNAVCPDGTPISSWVKVEVLRAAAANGQKLSQAEQADFIRAATHQTNRAIAAATSSAIAAEAAAQKKIQEAKNNERVRRNSKKGF